MLDLVTTLALSILAVSALLCVRRLVVGGSLVDRMVALDALLLVCVSGVAVLAIQSDSDAFLDVLLIAALIGFIGSVTIARYISWRGTS